MTPSRLLLLCSQSELCKKDFEFVLKAEEEEIKNMKKKGNESMKISPLFHSTYAKVKELLEANKPIRDGDWSGAEVWLLAHRCIVNGSKASFHSIS
jgi:hypothetical protein